MIALTKLDLILEQLTRLTEKVATLEADLKEIQQSTTNHDLIIENEIRVNILRVAKAHQDLSKELNECRTLSSEVKNIQMLQDLRINRHDAKLMTL